MSTNELDLDNDGIVHSSVTGITSHKCYLDIIFNNEGRNGRIVNWELSFTRRLD